MSDLYKVAEQLKLGGKAKELFLKGYRLSDIYEILRRDDKWMILNGKKLEWYTITTEMLMYLEKMVKKMTKIKPCPFCGGEIITLEYASLCDIKCSKRGCWLEFGAGWQYDNEDKLIQDWNIV